ncbi:membrane-bound ghrelin O-acyltransferase MBOAT4 [Petromyzon marinus]|uniref:membrane-bound ghrelin O-acyltransferase MBOAT4 n=1 Tax=Petromyzon marinus TaxID=7757 RepID=UPI003F70B87E
MNHSLWLKAEEMVSCYYEQLYQTTLLQLSLVPVALLYQRLVVRRRISIQLRYLLLLAGGLAVLLASFGASASLVLLPAAGSVALTRCVPPAVLFRRTLVLQMAWQLLCHLHVFLWQQHGVDTDNAGHALVMPSLMLLTQRVTSLALDVQERRTLRHGGHPAALQHLAYLLYFPVILGGPHCSFCDFVDYVEGADSDVNRDLNPSRCVCKKLAAFFPLDALRGWLLARCLCHWEPAFRDERDFMLRTSFLQRMWLLWETALAIRLCYYTQWLLGESLTVAAGLGYRRRRRADDDDAGPGVGPPGGSAAAAWGGPLARRPRGLEGETAARPRGDAADAARAALRESHASGSRTSSAEPPGGAAAAPPPPPRPGRAGGGGGGQWDELWDLDACALEGACRMSALARTWNRTAALWLRRVAFARSPRHPLAATFAFSALWHGLHPGHCAAMAVWALGVEADRRVRAALAPRWRRSWPCRAAAWLWTQATFAFVLLLAEFRGQRGGLVLVTRCTHGLVPLLLCLLAVLLVPRQTAPSTLPEEAAAAAAAVAGAHALRSTIAAV